MRKLTAPLILAPGGNLVENCTLLMEDDVVYGLLNEVPGDAETFSGIIAPGFINTHCHLELSHLQNKINPETGLHGFIKSFVEARKTYTHGIAESAAFADAEMWRNGIQGVGDICNTGITFPVKKNSPVRYHNFVELFNMNPESAGETFMQGEALCRLSSEDHLSASLVPHAPYSVPDVLFRLILHYHQQKKSCWSIHNQETASENELFIHGTGELANCFDEMGINRSWFHPTGKNSLASISGYFPESANLLFVHNTFTTHHDIDFLKTLGVIGRSWFAVCAKANLFIESRLPDISMLVKSKCNVTIGTDSLASNDALSVLDELKVLHQAYPEVEIARLLTWATSNGADYFGWKDLGVFGKGCRPGVIHITECGRNFISESAEVRRII